MRAADDTRPTEPADLLDAWLANPAVRTHHRSAAAVEPRALWESATKLRLSDTRTLGRLVRWRIPGLDRNLTYGELFRAYPFTVLEEGERHLLAGLCGRIWTLARDYPRLDGTLALDLGVRDRDAEAVLEGLLFAVVEVGVGEDDDAVGREGRERVLDRDGGLALPGVAGGVDALLLE